MRRNITKVKTVVKKNREIPPIGWKAVLADIQADVSELKKLVQIVERKIERGEAWPIGEPSTQN